MLGIIIWIFIIYFIFIKKRNTQNRTDRRTSQANTSRTVQPPQRNFAVVTEQKKVQPNVERKCAVEDRHRSENNVYQKRTVQQTSVPNVKRDYTEAPRQTKMEKKATRMVATRLYEGDRVPQGYRMVKCGYCAAENLIPYTSRGDYMCYFCHEDI